jgi:superfamily II DNA helicase RecQ
MSLHFFHIPARAPEPAQSELNAFLAGHRVLAVQREWLADGAHSGWAFCVEVATGPGTLPGALKVDGAARGQRSQDVDYKQVLGEADFAVFARLRAVRKQLAQADGVPVYAVASNEQLAALVTRRVHALDEMTAIDGLGPARVGKYGAALLAVLTATEAPDYAGSGGHPGGDTGGAAGDEAGRP